jgi:Fe-S-cluster containining protein
MLTESQTAALLQQDAQLLRIVDQAFADSARRSADHLKCRPGCTQCCHGAFAISPLDALRLRSGMAELATSSPALAAAIQTRARNYVAEFAPSFPGDPVTGVLGTCEEALAAFEDFANDAPCPALNPETGLCDVYQWRPMTCRVFGPPLRLEPDLDAQPGTTASPSDPSEPPAFAVCELCFTEATEEEIAAAELHIPRQEEARLAAQLTGDQAATEPSPETATIVAYCLIPDTIEAH